MENDAVWEGYYYYPHKKIMHYINASIETTKVVRVGSFLMLLLSMAMFTLGLVTKFMFETISTVTFAFSMIIPILLAGFSLYGITNSGRVAVFMEKMEDGKRASFTLFMSCTGMVMALAFLTGCYACVLLVGIIVVSGIIICIIWNWKTLRDTSDYKIIGQNGKAVVDVSSIGTRDFNSMSSYKEPENPVFSITDESESTRAPEVSTPIPQLSEEKSNQPAGIP